MNTAVLLAAGSGKRMGGPEPKQYMQIGGRTVLEHSIRAFHQHPQVDNILVVVHKDYLTRARAIAAPYAKVTGVIEGGRERYDSSLAAIRATADGDLLLIHDAARPLVSQRIISDCLSALGRYSAVDVAIPATDTVVEVDADGRIARIPPRSALRQVQTPQCFRREVIAEAYRRGLADPDFTTTDDCGVVFRYLPDVPIYVVAGEPSNLKLTYPEDFALAQRLLS